MTLTFDGYQDFTRSTAQYPGLVEGYMNYPMTKLAGETGEFLEKVGKFMRHNDVLNVSMHMLTEEEITALAKELGDVLWYVAQLADLLGITLSDIALQNVAKLKDRKERGVIDGVGDER